jgi:hypothetical protein
MGLKERGGGAITGIGETTYSRNSGKSVVALLMAASLAAIADAGLAPTDIDGIIAYAPSGVVAEDFVTNFGIPDLRFSATTCPTSSPSSSRRRRPHERADARGDAGRDADRLARPGHLRTGEGRVDPAGPGPDPVKGNSMSASVCDFTFLI